MVLSSRRHHVSSITWMTIFFLFDDFHFFVCVFTQIWMHRTHVGILRFISQLRRTPLMQWTIYFRCTLYTIQHFIAVQCVYVILVFFLFYRNVSANILNDKKQSPIHLATALNKVTALKVMGNYRNIIDIQKGGEHGRTALHLAAIFDHEECARILVCWVMQKLEQKLISHFISLMLCVLTFCVFCNTVLFLNQTIKS